MAHGDERFYLLDHPEAAPSERGTGYTYVSLAYVAGLEAEKAQLEAEAEKYESILLSFEAKLGVCREGYRKLEADLAAKQQELGSLRQQLEESRKNHIDANQRHMRTTEKTTQKERRALELGFRGGYHSNWIRSELRYIFDPAMKPGDPDGAFAAFEYQHDSGTLPSALYQQQHQPTQEES